MNDTTITSAQNTMGESPRRQPLQQQQQQHKRPVSPSRPNPSRRGGPRRSPLSCLSCRQHKLRCDRRVPCGTCTRYRREAQCRLNPAPTRKQPAGIQAAVPAEPRVPELVMQPEKSSCQPRARFHHRQLSDPIVEDEDEDDHAHHADYGSGSIGRGRDRSEVPSTQENEASIANRLSTLGGFGIGTIPSSPLPELLAEASRHHEGQSLWGSMFDTRNRQRLWQQQLSAVLPSRAQCDLLLNFYVEHINWIFQTVHVPSLRRDYERFWDLGLEKADLIWTSLLFTIISVSALYVPLEAVTVVNIPRESIRSLAHLWHLASQHALRAGDFEAKPCLVQLQTFSITQLYWYATNRIEMLNSRLGQAVRNAQALNLDQETSESTCLQDEMKHRIWWDLVDSDMFQTVCLGRPPLIRLRLPSVPLPLNCSDCDISDDYVRPRPLDEPTEMSMNTFRARVFQILSRNYFANNLDQEPPSYQRVIETDSELTDLMTRLPWYFQIQKDGRPPRIPGPLSEVLPWQHHIFRTLVSTQRIRMYRPFLSARIGDSWDNCVKAAADQLIVYRTLREDVSPTCRHKFLPQAYQIFSVAVTAAALLLVEGSLPIPNITQQLRDMAADLQIVEVQGCPVPVATNGRKVLLKMLSLYDWKARGPTTPEEARSLVPDIAIILGGERTTIAYMDRLAAPADETQLEIPAQTDSQNDEVAPQGDQVPAWPPEEETENATLVSLLNLSWNEMDAGGDPALFPEDATRLDLLNWDMTGLLLDSQNL